MSYTWSNGTSFDEDMKQLKLIDSADKSIHTHPLWPSIRIPRKWPNKNAHICVSKHMYENIIHNTNNFGIIDNSQKLGMSLSLSDINRLKIAIHLHNGLSLVPWKWMKLWDTENMDELHKHDFE